MLNVCFNSYGKYTTNYLYQWDKNQIIEITGLNLSNVPEIHFTNAAMDRAIARQATMSDGVIKADIPNSMLQSPFAIVAYVGIYNGTQYKTIEAIKIPIIPRSRPTDYVLEKTNDEVYSFNHLENLIANLVTLQDFGRAVANLNEAVISNKTSIESQIANIIAHNNDTEGNTELIDLRASADGTVYDSAGAAIRGQFDKIKLNLTEIQNTFKSENLIDPDKCESGYINYVNGTVNTHDTYMHTDYIPVINNMTYCLNQSMSTSHFAFYTADKTVFSGTGTSIIDYNGGIVSDWIYFVAPTDGFVRVTVKNAAAVESAMMILGTVAALNTEGISPNEYIPYNLSLSKIAKEFKNLSQEFNNASESFIDKPSLSSLLPTALQGKFIQYFNLIDSSKVTVGKYITTNGQEAANSEYDATEYIAIMQNTYYLFNNNLTGFVPRTLAFYDKNKSHIASAFMDAGAGTSSYVISPVENAAFIRITLPTGKAEEYMLTMDSAPKAFVPFGKYLLKKELIDGLITDTDSKIAYAHCGGNALKAHVKILASETQLNLSNFPQNLKKGLSLTFYAKLNSLTKLTIGMGYNAYRGDWLEIDGTNVVSKHYDSGVSIRETKQHGLSIGSFLFIAMNVDNDSVCHCTLNTLSGSAVLNFSWLYEHNGIPFVFGEQNMTDVEFSAVANDIGYPIWLFGDSYFGVAANRIVGQLKNLGYADSCLIDGVAGQKSAGAYSEFEKLIALGGAPKILVWCLGMNDNASTYQIYLNKLQGLSEKYGFELVLQRIPVVPGRIEANTGVNGIVAGSGLRYVDAYEAVGSNESGAWYDGFISSDALHPDVPGAKAIAARMLVDVPELMQYGYNPGNINGGITGDK